MRSKSTATVGCSSYWEFTGVYIIIGSIVVPCWDCPIGPKYQLQKGTTIRNYDGVYR